MSKRMLIDASHPEETRVVVLDTNNKVAEFDFESASRRPLKGNIYLAKVTRVEPSLQAAFVEYGGNRQGFLAFTEIHPDYYQIPVADRMALLADQSRRLMEEDDEIDSVAIATTSSHQTVPISDGDDAGAAGANETSDDDAPEGDDDRDEFDDSEQAQESYSDSAVDTGEQEAVAAGEGDTPEPGAGDDAAAEDHAHQAVSELAPHAEVLTESTGIPARTAHGSRRQRTPRRRHYKIQEVIRRKQVILVQVVKEERGNKGASLTTYLSLAGRYCVLMPNTPRGGGISRKITSATDRKRLKSAAQSLELPEGMGLIIRTAGANRTKAEIKRDYEYLLRLWDSVRELTLKSNAPALVYEEGNLIKRAIRDLYGKEVSEVVVSGDGGYREAKDFMRMLMPSHAKNVKPYREPIPLFSGYNIESQLDAMFSPVVTLRSGGYIVINQTEALVSIDVNSGKATREHSIEETAHKTNLEAADEIARQLRLRDLAGLIVIDFIDMEDGKNDRHVEKRLRDAVREDRARIQIGKISQFGLLEMSRQRLRAGVIAGSTVPCTHCAGLGYVRSTESAALQLLRALEEEGQELTVSSVLVRAPTEIVIYALNHKRAEISRIEQAYEITIQFEANNTVSTGSFEIVRLGRRVAPKQLKQRVVSPEAGFQEQEDVADEEVEETETESESETEPETEEGDAIAAPAREETAQPAADSQTDSSGRRRRRRRRRGGRGRTHEPAENNGAPAIESVAVAEDKAGEPAEAAPENSIATGDAATEAAERKRRRRRRGRRGRRRDQEGGADVQPSATATEQSHYAGEISDDTGDVDEDAGASRSKDATPAESAAQPQWAYEDVRASAEEAEDDAQPEPDAADPMIEVEVPPRPAHGGADDGSSAGTKRGWWQRRFGI